MKKIWNEAMEKFKTVDSFLNCKTNYILNVFFENKVQDVVILEWAVSL